MFFHSLLPSFALFVPWELGITSGHDLFDTWELQDVQDTTFTSRILGSDGMTGVDK